MNIELIKSELKRLTSLVASWNSGESVSAIERDLALVMDKSVTNGETVRIIKKKVDSLIMEDGRAIGVVV